MYNTHIQVIYNHMIMNGGLFMRLIQLVYFQKVAQLENVTKAAEELYISQPALSKQMRQLEDELGAPLFLKKGRNIILSPYGQKFYPYVNEALSQINKGVESINQMIENKENIYSIHLEVGSMWIPGLIQHFQKTYPELHFNLSQHTSSNKDDFDFLITSELNQEDNFIELLEEEILLAVPANHELAKKESISIKDLKKIHVIGLTKQNALRRTLDQYMKQLNVKLDLSHESDDPSTLRGLIKAGIGVTFIPTVLWEDLAGSETVLRSFSEGKLSRKVYLCWKNANKKNPYNDIIIEEISNFFKNKTNQPFD